MVESANVSLDTGVANIYVRAANQFDAFQILPQLVELVNGLGFEAQPHFDEE